jgi:TetR/AcrR family transcriptional regulator, regulator of autoinduction and epiphytic fitness
MTEQAMIDGRTARRDRNRLAVLDAVLELFAAGDLSPSPEAVAQRSGLSLRSVYRYVADSDDLVLAAIERHLQKVGPLFAVDPPGTGSFDTRVEAFLDARMRLYLAIAPTARAAYLRTQLHPTPSSEIIARLLEVRRLLLRSQLERQFAAELDGLGGLREPVLRAADAMTQIESVDWYLTCGGYTTEETRAALSAGLRRLLQPRHRGATP